MYFPRLESIGERYSLPSDLVAAFDGWLAVLPNARRQAILPADFAKEAGLDFAAACTMFRAGNEAGFLRPVFSVFCPECEDFVGAVRGSHHLEDLQTCMNGHEFIPADDNDFVRVSYEVTDRPDTKKKELNMVVFSRTTRAVGI